jgi:hypothetical protein
MILIEDVKYIMITSPSLDVNENVSGISSVPGLLSIITRILFTNILNLAKEMLSIVI